MTTPSQIYHFITKDQLIDHCKRHRLRIIGFRRPSDGELCINSMINADVYSYRSWVTSYGGGTLHAYRIIVERIQE